MWNERLLGKWASDISKIAKEHINNINSILVNKKLSKKKILINYLMN